jgi:hypothetical protein
VDKLNADFASMISECSVHCQETRGCNAVNWRQANKSCCFFDKVTGYTDDVPLSTCFEQVGGSLDIDTSYGGGGGRSMRESHEAARRESQPAYGTYSRAEHVRRQPDTRAGEGLAKPRHSGYSGARARRQGGARGHRVERGGGEGEDLTGLFGIIFAIGALLLVFLNLCNYNDQQGSVSGTTMVGGVFDDRVSVRSGPGSPGLNGSHGPGRR